MYLKAIPAWVMPPVSAEPSDANTFDTVYNEIDWESKTPARKERWMALSGENYTYGSGRGVRTYESQPMPMYVKALMDVMNERMGWDLNCCMANLYADEHQHLGWHSDDSPEMDPEHVIVSVSFGAERWIHFRPIGVKGEATHKFFMPHGSAVIMLPHMQEEWEHKIPKHSQPCGARASLTYRRLCT